MMASVAKVALREEARVIALSRMGPIRHGIEKPRPSHRRVTLGIEVRKNGKCRVQAQTRWQKEAERVKGGYPLRAQCQTIQEDFGKIRFGAVTDV